MLNGLWLCYYTHYTKGMFFAYARRILLKHVLHTLKKILRLSHLKFRNLNQLANIIPLNYGEAPGFPYYEYTSIKAVLSDDEGMGRKAYRNPACIMPGYTEESH